MRSFISESPKEKSISESAILISWLLFNNVAAPFGHVASMWDPILFKKRSLLEMKLMKLKSALPWAVVAKPVTPAKA